MSKWSKRDLASSERKYEEAVVRAIEEMRTSLDETQSLKRAAAAGMYSPFHFHRMFRRTTGTTPARYVAALRMQHAKRLLAANEISVTDVSLACGYQSLGTFSTQFSRLVGVSPGRFRVAVKELNRGSTISDLEGAGCGRSGIKICWTHPDSIDPGERTVVAAFFGADIPCGKPTAFVAARGTDSPCSLSSSPATGPAIVFALSVPQETSLLDLALGDCSEVYVAREVAYVDRENRVCGQEREPLPGGTIQLSLRCLQAWDPPIVSAAPVLFLLSTMWEGK